MKKHIESTVTPSECQSEILYDVVVCDGKDFLIPDNCVECGKRIKGKESVSSNGKFKICSTCRQRKKSLLHKIVYIFIISVISGIVAFFISAFLYRAKYALSVFISSVFAAVAFTVISLLLNVPNNCKTTSPGEAAKIQRRKDGKSTAVILKNNTFAEKFREINGQTVKHSDIFEHAYIRKKAGNSLSIMVYMRHFTIKMLSAALCCTLILTCCYPILSTFQNRFNTYIDNTCIYPGCSLNRGKNLYYCDNHKCLTESCERPIHNEDVYCHVHGE